MLFLREKLENFHFRLLIGWWKERGNIQNISPFRNINYWVVVCFLFGFEIVLTSKGTAIQTKSIFFN